MRAQRPARPRAWRLKRAALHSGASAAHRVAQPPSAASAASAQPAARPFHRLGPHALALCAHRRAHGLACAACPSAGARQVQTLEKGYNSGRAYYFRTQTEEQRDALERIANAADAALNAIKALLS